VHGGTEREGHFVVEANMPPQFRLFERIGDYDYLNALDGMTGRIALPTGSPISSGSVKISAASPRRGGSFRDGQGGSVAMAIDNRVGLHKIGARSPTRSVSPVGCGHERGPERGPAFEVGEPRA
jgi:hypothetical protein